MSQTHTPGSWDAWVEDGQLHEFYRITDGNGLLVATGILPEHAERIVLCCNAHDGLVAALKDCLIALHPGKYPLAHAHAKAALAKAGEK